MATEEFSNATWIADSGASTHMGFVDDGMRDVQEIDEPIKVGNGNKARAIKKGSLPLMLRQANGDTMDILLEDYKHSPELGVCLFSLTKALEKGWQISNDGLILTLTKASLTIRFDRISKTRDGCLVGVDLVPRLGEEANAATEDQTDNNNHSKDNNNKNKNKEGSDTKVGTETTKDKPKAHWEINRFHKVFGHASDASMRATAKHYGWKLVGTLDPCDHCPKANAQQKGVPKTTDGDSNIPGERLFFDTSSVSEHSSLGGGRYWLCAVDDATAMTWSEIITTKDEVPGKMLTLIKNLKARGNVVKYLRCDDAGENKTLQATCEKAEEDYLRNIRFEFTSRETPQLNGKVERKIAVITRRIRAILDATGLPEDMRKPLWGEAVKYCTDIENTLKSRSYETPAYVAFFGRELEGLKFLRQFGEIGYVKWGGNIKGKLKDRGVPMLYLGRALNHSADTYRMMNIATMKVINTRDAVWMKQSYGEWKKLDLPIMPDAITVLPDEIVEQVQQQAEAIIGNNNNNPETTPMTTMMIQTRPQDKEGRVTRRLKLKLLLKRPLLLGCLPERQRLKNRRSSWIQKVIRQNELCELWPSFLELLTQQQLHSQRN